MPNEMYASLADLSQHFWNDARFLAAVSIWLRTMQQIMY